MGAINGIIHTALIIVVSIAVVVGAGAAVYVWYTVSGQEEGE